MYTLCGGKGFFFSFQPDSYSVCCFSMKLTALLYQRALGSYAGQWRDWDGMSKGLAQSSSSLPGAAVLLNQVSVLIQVALTKPHVCILP